MNIQRTIQILSVAVIMLGSVGTGVIHAANSPAKPETASSIAAGKVSLNKSDVKALMQIKGMSAYKAHAIVAYRKQNGDFKTMGDLTKVKGFKRMKPEGIKSLSDQMLLD